MFSIHDYHFCLFRHEIKYLRSLNGNPKQSNGKLKDFCENKFRIVSIGNANF